MDSSSNTRDVGDCEIRIKTGKNFLEYTWKINKTEGPVLIHNQLIDA